MLEIHKLKRTVVRHEIRIRDMEKLLEFKFTGKTENCERDEMRQKELAVISASEKENNNHDEVDMQPDEV